MKVSILIEKDDITRWPARIQFEITDGEAARMVENDYRQRKDEADDKGSVKRRDVQEIIDEELNKPLYNNWHKSARHRGQLPKRQKDGWEEDGADPIEEVADESPPASATTASCSRRSARRPAPRCARR